MTNTTNTKEAIDALRARIRALEAERDELSHQRRSRSEVAALITARVEEWGAVAGKQLRRDLRQLAAGEYVHLLHAPANETAYGSASMGPHLVGLLGRERVVQYLCQHLDDEVAEGLSANARAARVTEIGEKLFALEEQEEALIEESELGDTPVLRRADANPAVILGAHDAAPNPAPRSPHYLGLGDVSQVRKRLAVYPTFPSRA